MATQGQKGHSKEFGAAAVTEQGQVKMIQNDSKCLKLLVHCDGHLFVFLNAP